jgi:hypothetical protein
MTWMWVVAPTIVLLGALWLVIGMRRLVGSRLALEDEVASAASTEAQADAAHDASTQLRDATESLARRREPDADPPGPDR